MSKGVTPSPQALADLLVNELGVVKIYGESVPMTLARLQREMIAIFNDFIKEKAMKTYIGIKAVQAEPSAEAQHLNRPIPASKNDPLGMGRSGYRVIYADGYESWSPAAAFEEAYVEVDADRAEAILADLRSDLDHLSAPESSDEATDRILGSDEPEWRDRDARCRALAFAIQATDPQSASLGGAVPRSIDTIIVNAAKISDFLEGIVTAPATGPAEPKANPFADATDPAGVIARAVYEHFSHDGFDVDSFLRMPRLGNGKIGLTVPFGWDRSDETQFFTTIEIDPAKLIAPRADPS